MLKTLLWVVVLYFACDFLIFRTGLYFKYVEPQSIAGSVVLGRAIVNHYENPARGNIIVLGDSRVGEGFSAKQANELATSTNLNFIGCGIPGSTPRVWYYFLRQVDPEQKKFSAIVLMTEALTDGELADDFVDYKIDANYCLPLLRWSDLSSFPKTFSKKEQRDRAWQSIAFPLVFAQKDIRGLIAHPVERFRKAALWHSTYPEAIYNYPGRQEVLPDLELEGNPPHPRDWKNVRESIRPQVSGYLAMSSGYYPHPPIALATSYRNEWYGEIAHEYSAKGVPVYVVLMPRGPYHTALKAPTAPSGSLAELSASGLLHLLPPSAFVGLEIPGNFCDQLHMNTIGRHKFTELLARLIMEQKH
ncbi:MAG TPA: hypothetical protein VGM64_14595 [Lacunisphaera sp.]